MARTRKHTAYTVYVCPFTHWDRDWYDPFQVFRGRLVELMDDLLDIFARYPDYTAFTLDGQTIPLEDYLEIRPERRADLEAAVADGRLAIGPFYVLPDLFLVSGEALVRNLFVGQRVARSFGTAMKVGYMPDPFGHPRTMPSIMRGFGIDSYIATRGVPREACAKGIVFRWVAPDGAEVVFTRQHNSYANLMLWGLKKRYPVSDPDVDFDKALHQAGTLLTSMREHGLATRTVLFNNGVDHQPPQAGVPAMIRAANEHFPDCRFVQGTHAEYATALRREAPDLQRHAGELHSGYQFHILSGVFSARMWIKQMNYACQRTLEALAEPLDAFCGVLGIDEPSPYLLPAWKHLLKTHPHDDICGCSVDEVHEDNAYDFRQARQLAEVSMQKQLRWICGHLDRDRLVDRRHLCLVYNPEPYARGATCEMPLVYQGDGIFDDAPVWHVRRADGTPVSSRVVGRSARPHPSGQPAHTWRFYDPELPACGYGVYLLHAGEPPPPPAELRIGRDGAIENAHLRAVLHADGSVDLLDKDTGHALRGLNVLTDEADVGDEYDFCPLAEPGEAITSRGARGRLDDPQLDVGHVERSTSFVLRLPAGVTAARDRRDRQLVAVPVRVTIRLRPGLRRLECTMAVSNAARDHRLRVCFPTGVRTRRVAAAGHFDIVERPVDPGRGTARDLQPSPATKPMDEWVAVRDRRRGALVTARGLPEYEAMAGDDGITLAITLLRCVGWLSRDDLATRRHEHAGPPKPTPGAQCLGEHTFDYAFMPFTGDPAAGGVLRWAREFGTPCDTMSVKPVSHLIRAPGGRLPHRASWLELDAPELVLSAIKRPEDGDGIIVRVFNPTARPVDGRLTFDRRIRTVRRVRLDETGGARERADGRAYASTWAPHEIRTLRLTLGPMSRCSDAPNLEHRSTISDRGAQPPP